MQRRIVCLALILFTGLSIPAILHLAKGQDAPAAETPETIIASIMGKIHDRNVDAAVAMMDGLKNQSDLQRAARERLIGVQDEQGQCHGFDIAAVQRFTPQVQTVDVLAYYDYQPALLRFHFYRPELTGKWNLLGFQVTTTVQEMADILKDTPVDYVGNRAAKASP